MCSPVVLYSITLFLMQSRLHADVPTNAVGSKRTPWSAREISAYWITVTAAVDADLQLLIDEYGGIPFRNSTYGVMADAHLNAHSGEDLAVGQRAPEILGTTADGEEMRLSQFLGKVVVLGYAARASLA